ncbi:nucleolar protein 9 isoform X2 [Bombus huntii]|uniref:nucleolar protein 9 isoform X2 n=1 Tax=Bombus huntii TaxID=85661 RepID=UPI0021AA5FAB|nr:nucleolar protein 9 isoform X2 [Bombus huntii]
MANDHGNDERGKKRKRKRSQIQMAKKLARQRNHGSDVDSETYQYMVHILELMKGDFSTTEEKLIFVNNVYEQTLGREVEYARNQVGSRILDSLLKYARLETIERLVAAFKSTLRPLSSDTFASHVLQKIIVVCADRGNKTTISGSCIERDADINIEVKDSEIESYNGIVLKLSKYFINNIEEFVFDTYANHVLRTVIECLGGLIDKSDSSSDKKKVIFGERRSVIQEYKDLLFETCNRLYRWPRFLEFGQDELTSGLLQSVLYSLNGTFPELMETYIKKITTECFKPGKEEQEPSNIFHAESSTRLLEACLSVASPKSLYTIYEEYFSGNLKRLSSMRSTNFSVQRLFDHCTAKEHFEQLFEEIHTHFTELLDTGHTGVLVSVANACLRLQTKQDVEELAQIFEDPKGSRIVDAFMDSKYIGEKSREKLAKKLKGHWAQLARSTHGSRSLDRIWEWARINQRTLIVEELAAVGESLRSTKSGQIMSNKLNVPLFTRNKKDWMEALGKEEKTRSLFVDIIGNTAKKGK